MNDEQLDELLNSARGSPQLPPVFKREVWRDIEQRQAHGTAAWMDALQSLLSMPKTRFAIWAVALGLGLFAGMRNHQKAADPVEVYAYSINPLAPAISR